MAVYVKDHNIDWYDSQHTEVQTTWRSPWYGEGSTEAFQHDLGIKEYHVIWSECTFMAGWTVVKEETVAAVHSAMPDYYKATMSITIGKGTTDVKAQVAPIIDTDSLDIQTIHNLFGDMFSATWPDYDAVVLPVGFRPPDVTNAPNIEWTDKYKNKIRISVTDYDPQYETDDAVWIGFRVKFDYNASNHGSPTFVDTVYNLIRWDRYENYAELITNTFPPGFGKVQFQARAYYGDGKTRDYPSWRYSPFSNELLSPPRAPSKVTITAIPTDENPNLLKVVIEEDPLYYNYTDHFEIEYTTNRDYFDSGYGTTVVSSQDDSPTVIINPGDEGGGTYYFRVKSVNDTGPSEWLYAEGSTSVGKEPDAPTTWTYTNSFVGGDDQYIIFYWTHNSRDGSTQRAAKILLKINDNDEISLDWPGVNYSSSSTYKEGDFVNYDNKIYRCIYDIDTPEAWNPEHWDYVGDGLKTDDVYSYKFPVFQYGQSGGVTTIKWSVKTRGVMETGGPDDDGYSKRSTIREVKVYSRPMVYITSSSSLLSSYPLILNCISTPRAQNPISYTFMIRSKMNYETMGFDGEPIQVMEDQVIYTKYGSFPDDTIDDPHNFNIELNAGDVHLENNIQYSMEISMGFDSGLTASSSMLINVRYDTSSLILITANIYNNTDNYSATINPIAFDISEGFVEDQPVVAEDTILSIYRREYNGEMTLIQDNINNTRGVAVIDPHPSLKSNNYRIIAINTVNGKVEYQDAVTIGLNDPCIIIQWDERYRYIENAQFVETPLENPLYQGTFLRLPFNIKQSESNDIDINNVKYIGRKRPVPYFGTQLGETASWSCEFDKNDEETIYKLRRLAMYMGDVYVREPTGMGYWASIKVSFNRDYESLIIPVTLEVTRVEGGGRP